MTTLTIIRIALRRAFEKTQLADPQFVAQALLSDYFNKSFTQLHVDGDMVVSDEQLAEIERLGQRLAAGEPLQYVVGKAHFGGRQFKVSPAVLIPRPETEELVRCVCEQTHTFEPQILDVGTGSGCIAVSLALDVPQSQVSAIDVSAEALEVARQNAELLGAKVSFEQYDILRQRPMQQFDIVVSNPPYVCASEKKEMEPMVLDYEPHLALFVPNTDPLRFYRKIAQHCASGMLRRGGMLFFEINERFGSAVKDMLKAEGFENIVVRADAYGKDRIAFATLT